MVQLRSDRRPSVVESGADIAQLALEPLDHVGLSLNDLDQLLVLGAYVVKRAAQRSRCVSRRVPGALRRRPGGTRSIPCS